MRGMFKEAFRKISSICCERRFQRERLGVSSYFIPTDVSDLLKGKPDSATTEKKEPVAASPDFPQKIWDFPPE